MGKINRRARASAVPRARSCGRLRRRRARAGRRLWAQRLSARLFHPLDAGLL